MYVYVCTCVLRVCVCICVCNVSNICMYVRMYVCVCMYYVYMYVCTYVRMYVYIYVYECMCVCKMDICNVCMHYICMCVYECMCVYVCMYVPLAQVHNRTCTTRKTHLKNIWEFHFKILGPISWQETSSTLITHKYKNHGTKFGGPKLPGAWDLYMPGTGEDVSGLVFAHFLNSY